MGNIFEVVKAELRRLKTETNYALEAAGKVQKQFVGEAINWADLKCLMAEAYLTDEGITGYRVFITEANPDSIKLHRMVQDHLLSRGFGDEVEVTSEW